MAPKIQAMPALPAPPPPVPDINQAHQDVRKNESLSRRARGGAATLMNSNKGDTSVTQTGGKQLLGQ